MPNQAICFFLVIFLSCAGSATNQVTETPDAENSAEHPQGDTSNPNLGGGCAYSAVAGQALLTAIHLPLESVLLLTFDFTPDDPQIVYRFPAIPDQGQTKTLPRFDGDGNDIVQKYYLTRNMRLRCLRMEITKGTCAPVVFVFPELNIW